MGRLHVSDKVLKEVRDEIKTRRIRTALFAIDAAEKQRKEQQAKVQVVDVDEAKRRFWRVILGLERDAGEEPEVPSKPHYSSELQPSIMVLDQMCSAIIESLEDPGFSQPIPSRPRSSAILPSLHRGSVMLSQLAEGSTAAVPDDPYAAPCNPKQLAQFSGAGGYRRAIAAAQCRRKNLAQEVLREVQTPAQLQESSRRTRELIQKILEEASTKPAGAPPLTTDALPAAPAATLQKILTSRHRGKADPGRGRAEMRGGLQIAGPAFMHAYEQRIASTQREQQPALERDRSELTGQHAQLEAAKALAQELTKEISDDEIDEKKSVAAHALPETSVVPTPGGSERVQRPAISGEEAAVAVQNVPLIEVLFSDRPASCLGGPGLPAVSADASRPPAPSCNQLDSCIMGRHSLADKLAAMEAHISAPVFN